VSGLAVGVVSGLGLGFSKGMRESHLVRVPRIKGTGAY
jgi:hypothetical protein